MKRFEIFFGIIKVPIDYIMTVIGFLAAYKLRLLTKSYGIVKDIDFTTFPSPIEYFSHSLFAAGLLTLIFALGKLYSLKTTNTFANETKKTITLWAIWVMSMITFYFFTRTIPFSRLAIFYTWVLTLILLITARGSVKVIQNALLKSGLGKRTLIFVGENDITNELKSLLKNNPSYKILQTVNSISKLKYAIKQKNVDEIIHTNTDNAEEIIEICETNHINYSFTPNLLEVKRSHIDVNTIGSIPLITLKKTPLDGWGKVVKRIIDIIGSTLGIFLLSPIFLITAIAIKLDSKGPILFSKLDNGKPAKRVGQFGTPFQFYKFRSMQPNTDSLRYNALAKNNTRTDGPLVKIKDDPRVTKVGRFIRKYSIDELPQLFSVFLGTMSLVGPRPHLPEEVAKYQEHHHFTLTIKPGITGLAQISGRSDLAFEQESKLDRYYIENWSFWLDIKIILKTVLIVLKGHTE